jgi:hypothetical protein
MWGGAYPLAIADSDDEAHTDLYAHPLAHGDLHLYAYSVEAFAVGIGRVVVSELPMW